MTLECVCTIWVSNERCTEHFKKGVALVIGGRLFEISPLGWARGDSEVFVRYGYQMKGVMSILKGVILSSIGGRLFEISP